MTMNLLLIAAGYLLGSLSSAIIICRLLGLPDPRGQGSGNPGATNVLRIGGKKAAAATLIGDMLKGLIPVLIAKLLGASLAIQALVAIAAFLGHLYPLFFGFKGGKGVATALGVLLGIHWPVDLAGHCKGLQILVSRRIARHPGDTTLYVVADTQGIAAGSDGSHAVHGRTTVLATPRQHKGPAGRHRKENRGQVTVCTRFSTP